MGHNGDIEAVYSTRKELNGDMVEEMRQAFAAAAKFIQTKGESPLEAARQEFEAKDKEHEDALTRIRLENLELKEKFREHDRMLAQLVEQTLADSKAARAEVDRLAARLAELEAAQNSKA
jgi:hypothetical protein